MLEKRGSRRWYWMTRQKVEIEVYLPGLSDIFFKTTKDIIKNGRIIQNLQ